MITRPITKHHEAGSSLLSWSARRAGVWYMVPPICAEIAGGKPTVLYLRPSFETMLLGIVGAGVEKKSVPLSKQIVMIHHEAEIIGLGLFCIGNAG